jgi:hypothetical protein
MLKKMWEFQINYEKQRFFYLGNYDFLSIQTCFSIVSIYKLPVHAPTVVRKQTSNEKLCALG